MIAITNELAPHLTTANKCVLRCLLARMNALLATNWLTGTCRLKALLAVGGYYSSLSNPLGYKYTVYSHVVATQEHEHSEGMIRTTNSATGRSEIR